MNTFTPVVRAFRFYADDGSESASNPLANQDTNYTTPSLSGNYAFHLRYSINETGAVSGSGDTYKLQYSLNSGAYADCSGSTPAAIVNSANLTNLGATTNRGTNGITDPTGTFVAGLQAEQATISHTLTASNFTEHVWSLSILNASVSNGDTLDFRVCLNGGTPGMTNSVTPRITVTKSTTHALASTAGSSRLDADATGVRRPLALASTGGSSQLDATAVGTSRHPLDATGGSSQLDADATGTHYAYASGTFNTPFDATSTGTIWKGLESSGGSSRLDADAAGIRLLALAATAGSSQLDADATGSVTMYLSATAGSSQLDGAAVGERWVGLAASSGSSQLDADAAGVRLLAVSSTAGSSQLDADAVGSAVHSLASTAGSSQLDADATGSVLIIHVLAATGGSSQLDASAAGVLQFALVSSSGSSRLDSDAAGVALLALASTAGSSRLDADAAGQILMALASTAGSSRLDADAAGIRMLALAASLGVSQLDADATGFVDTGGTTTHALESSDGTSRLDADAVGIRLLALAGNLGVSQLDADATGRHYAYASGTLTSSFDITSAGLVLHSLASTAGSSRLDGDAVGTHYAWASGTLEMVFTAVSEGLVIEPSGLPATSLGRRTVCDLFQEMMRSCGGIQYEGWRERAQYLLWEAYLDLASIYHHKELEEREDFDLAQGDTGMAYPTTVGLLIGVAEITTEGVPTYQLEQVHLGQLTGSTLAAGRPRRFCTVGRAIFFERPLDIGRRYAVLFQRKPNTIDCDAPDYFELSPVWDSHILELALAKAGARTMNAKKVQRNLLGLREYAELQGQPLLSQGYASLRAARPTQDTPQAWRFT